MAEWYTAFPVMVLALICTSHDAEAELGQTLLWRMGIERRVVSSALPAKAAALEDRPDVVVVDRDLPAAAELIEALRGDPQTRRTSIVVMARGEFESSEIAMLEAGANAVLRLPVGREWDERLIRLIDVPVRRQVRLAVTVSVSAGSAFSTVTRVGQALNISVAGMLLEVQGVSLEVGDDIDAVFRLPGSVDALRVSGRVVRLAGTRRYGVEFRGFDLEVAELIRAFVEAGVAAGA